jgi:acyl-CoA reductase-like NAD-dependent aldehyde dehydrogenase
MICGVLEAGREAKLPDEFVSATEALMFGDPLDPENDMGALIDEPAAVRVENLIEQAVAIGARLLWGGGRKGALMAPTVLDCVPRDSEIVVHETFGQTAPIIRIESIEDAVAVANSTIYGLQAGVFTRKLQSALYLAKHLEVGGVVINQAPGFWIEYLPFGGVTMSGVGREGIRCAVQAMTEIKTVLVNLV